jgi:exodeoxyribonuclease-5
VAKGHYERCSESYRAFVAAVTNAAFARFVAEFKTLGTLYTEYKREAALLDFDDLIHYTRDLLAGNETVRQSLSQRYPRILVDEFQDTDPLQAEILWRLCGEAAGRTHWADRHLRRGSLFLVGDPKQAIYRFRGADVDTYIVAKEALEKQSRDSVLKITANFRSLKPILDFVNAQFDGLLSDEMGQPGFTALEPIHQSQDDRPAVACFDVVIGDHHRTNSGRVSADAARQEEAITVATLIRRLIGSYEVRSKGSSGLRPCRAGDIALLAPTGTNLWIYERALEDEGISIGSQAGKSFLRRQEVQDLIAIARTIADRRDTLALGALLRGPLVGLTEEELADAIMLLPRANEEVTPRLELWTDVNGISHPILRRTLEVLQSLGRKARQTTPYQIMAEAVEELCIRPKLTARHRRGAERALANVELFLEMARPYDARGIVSFVEALRKDWQAGEKEPEGRPDADADAVSITTIHSAKGLEWPIVIPINSPTVLRDRGAFLYRPSDDSVHFELLGQAGPEYELVKDEEKEQTRRERVRLWYVALTRACDLLLLPRQSDRVSNDWFSLLKTDLAGLPSFDHMTDSAGSTSAPTEVENRQDVARWSAEAAIIAATRRTVKWRSPSRHESGSSDPPDVSEDEIYTDTLGPGEPPRGHRETTLPTATIKGSRERGLLLHKLIEELLTGETDETMDALVTRAKQLLAELDMVEAEHPKEGPHTPELAATALGAMTIPEVAALRPRLVPETTVFSAETSEDSIAYVGGVADAIAFSDDDTPDVVVEWKSDVDPGAAQVALYREQIGDYLVTTGAREGLLVFVSTGRVERVLVYGE